MRLSSLPRLVLLFAALTACGLRKEHLTVENKHSLTSVELQRRFETSPVTGAGMSRVVPLHRGEHTEAVGFIFGVHVDGPSSGSVDSPGEIRILDASAGTVIRTERYGKARWTAPADAAGTQEERRRQSERLFELQDQLSASYYAGAPAVPTALDAARVEYLRLFPAVVGPSLVRAYVDVAPEWCAWVGLGSAP